MATKSNFESSHRKRLIQQLAKDQGWHCEYCGILLDDPENSVMFSETRSNGEVVFGLPVGIEWPKLDHKVPVAKGGSNDPSNLVLCCNKCNSLKGHRLSYEDFKARTAPLRAAKEALCG